MRKHLIDKRIELFKEAFPEFKESGKSDSLYAVFNTRKVRNIYKKNHLAVTKNTLDKLDNEFIVEKNISDVILITPRGRMMVKYIDSMRFKNISIKDIRKLTGLHNFSKSVIKDDECINKLIEAFFIGRKYEWMKEYNTLWFYKYFTGFNSLNAAKNHLGYTFISNKEFVDIIGKIGNKNFKWIIYGHLQNKQVQVFRFINKNNIQLLEDLNNMRVEMGFSVIIPDSVTELNEQHDELIVLKNMSKYRKYEKNVRYYYYSDIFDKLNKSGIEYEVLDTYQSVECEGRLQNHCLSSYSKRIDNYLFLTIFYKDKKYNIQIHPNGVINQFYGRFNQRPPKELIDIVEPLIKGLPVHILEKEDKKKEINYNSSRNYIDFEKKLIDIKIIKNEKEELPF